MRRAIRIALLIVIGGSRNAFGQDCLPVTASSIEIVAERYALEPDQIQWLCTRFEQGTLHDPSSLDNLPGAGPDLLRALETSFCWSVPARVRVIAGMRWRDGVDAERSSLIGERSPWEIEASVHRDPGNEFLRIRGGGRVLTPRWTLAGGALENRQGLGLCIRTAGTEERGGAPRRRATTEWTPTSAMGESVLGGLALGVRPGAWSVSIAAVRAFLAPERECLVVGLGRGSKDGGVSCNVWVSGRRAGSVVLWRILGNSEWSAEAAAGQRGQALGSAFGLTLSSWRVRGSLTWTGAGYASPLVSGGEEPREDGGLAAAAEARWSGGRGRFVRLFRSMDRRPSRSESTPPTCAASNEVEWVEPFRPGLEAAFLWRLRHAYPDGSPSEIERSQEGQGEVRWTRRGFTVRTRFIERFDGNGSAAWQVSLGRPRDRLAWEIRAAHGTREVGSVAVPVYMRRAGSWSGSTSLSGETAIGMWLRYRLGSWSLEASGDGGGERWTGALSLLRTWGGAS